MIVIGAFLGLLQSFFTFSYLLFPYDKPIGGVAGNFIQASAHMALILWFAAPWLVLCGGLFATMPSEMVETQQ